MYGVEVMKTYIGGEHCKGEYILEGPFGRLGTGCMMETIFARVKRTKGKCSEYSMQ